MHSPHCGHLIKHIVIFSVPWRCLRLSLIVFTRLNTLFDFLFVIAGLLLLQLVLGELPDEHSGCLRLNVALILQHSRLGIMYAHITIQRSGGQVFASVVKVQVADATRESLVGVHMRLHATRIESLSMNDAN